MRSFLDAGTVAYLNGMPKGVIQWAPELALVNLAKTVKSLALRGGVCAWAEELVAMAARPRTTFRRVVDMQETLMTPRDSRKHSG